MAALEKGESKGRDRFGEITAVAGGLLYIAALMFIVAPLPSKFDTFLIVSWVFAPVIIGSLIYIRIERAGGWRQSNSLK